MYTPVDQFAAKYNEEPHGSRMEVRRWAIKVNYLFRKTKTKGKHKKRND